MAKPKPKKRRPKKRRATKYEKPLVLDMSFEEALRRIAENPPKK